MKYTNEIRAVLLIHVAEEIISKRRKCERMCGYPDDYGGDKLLLQRLQEFLEDKKIKTIRKNAMEKL